ncbi:MAG TPA: sigma-70 family RNA polymerase sigma factor [Chloroflexota bacterium]|nr:sigma-70 family RNA polymerase sigma factor [Chloroflexota bacterium]
MNANELCTADWHQYLREIGQHPLLEAAEELELARAMDAGRDAARVVRSAKGTLSEGRRAELEMRIETGRRARERLVESNLRLVVSIAGRYTGRGVSLQDLIQEGNVGLQVGIDKYEWRKGFRLSTYVYWWIRQAMTRALANGSRFIRLPVHAGDLLRRAALLEQRLGEDLDRTPALAELAAELGIQPERLHAIRLAASAPASLDRPVAGDSERTRGEIVPDDRALTTMQSIGEHDELAKEVADALQGLPAREREVLRLRYGLGDANAATLVEIGARLGVTRERARQIESQALRKLRGDRRLRRALAELQTA